MDVSKTQTKNEYAKMVSLFLAEMLRTRNVTLHRAADIAEKVVANVNLIDSDKHFLTLVHELSREFHELNPLEERFFMHVKISARKDLETKVRSFAVHTMVIDLTLASEILKEATKPELSIDDLCQRFPTFKQFIETANI